MGLLQRQERASNHSGAELVLAVRGPAVDRPGDQEVVLRPIGEDRPEAESFALVEPIDAKFLRWKRPRPSPKPTDSSAETSCRGRPVLFETSVVISANGFAGMTRFSKRVCCSCAVTAVSSARAGRKGSGPATESARVTHSQIRLAPCSARDRPPLVDDKPHAIRFVQCSGRGPRLKSRRSFTSSTPRGKRRRRLLRSLEPYCARRGRELSAVQTGCLTMRI
jgi:hypothetical protein